MGESALLVILGDVIDRALAGAGPGDRGGARGGPGRAARSGGRCRPTRASSCPFDPLRCRSTRRRRPLRRSSTRVGGPATRDRCRDAPTGGSSRSPSAMAAPTVPISRTSPGSTGCGRRTSSSSMRASSTRRSSSGSRRASPTSARCPRRSSRRGSTSRGRAFRRAASRSPAPRRAVHPTDTPGGWRLIGRTDLRPWDVTRDPPALILPGDRVRFVPVRRPTVTLEVVEPGLLTTVQDAGRPDWTHLGVPVGGACDPWSLAVANLLAGADAGAAALEMTIAGPTLAVRDDDDRRPRGRGPRWRRAGDGPAAAAGPFATRSRRARRSRSRAETPAPGRAPTSRCPGGIDVPVVLGSRSTLLSAGFGGIDGRPLRAGDLVGRRRPSTPGPPPGSAPGRGSTATRSRRPANRSGSWQDPRPASRRSSGERGASAPRATGSASASRPTTTRQHASGTGTAAGSGELLSHGVVHGAIQLPPGGTPLVLLADHQTTGGYPVAAVVARADHPRLGQLRPGEVVRFVAVGPDEARRRVCRAGPRARPGSGRAARRRRVGRALAVRRPLASARDPATQRRLGPARRPDDPRPSRLAGRVRRALGRPWARTARARRRSSRSPARTSGRRPARSRCSARRSAGSTPGSCGAGSATPARPRGGDRPGARRDRHRDDRPSRGAGAVVARVHGRGPRSRGAAARRDRRGRRRGPRVRDALDRRAPPRPDRPGADARPRPPDPRRARREPRPRSARDARRDLGRLAAGASPGASSS